jgi:hypothetical protein
LAKSLPLDSFGSDPLLKTTGVAITLAGVLEDNGEKEEAYKIYQEALRHLQSTYLNLPPDAPLPDLDKETLKRLTNPEKMRAAALAYKLGGMAPELGKPDKEQEKWLTSSVNAVSVAALEAPAGSDKAEKIPSARRLHIMGSDMRLPDWAKNHSIAAPFEALGSFYSKRQNP